MPELDLGSVVGPQGKQGEIGPAGKQGIQGKPGTAATINGVNTLTITAGDNVTLKQEGSALEIGAVVLGKNLLLNWDFRNPVNRNGKIAYIGSARGAYTLDRWLFENTSSSGGSLTITDAGIQFSRGDDGYSSMIQRLADKSLAGAYVTFSILCQDGLYQAKFPFMSSPTAGVACGPFRVYCISSGLYIRLLANSASLVTPVICAAKLELGTQQTLARQNEDGEWEIIDPPDYDLQYALCSLYSPSTGEWVGYQHSNPNLLDNWYFADPIDQRQGYIVPAGTSYYQFGVSDAPVAGTLTAPVTVKRFHGNNAPIFDLNGTEYYSAIGSAVRGYCGIQYGIDRWHGKGVQLKNGYLHVEGPMYQAIEADVAKFYYGKRITLSILLADGSLYSGSNVVPSEVTSSNQWRHCCSVINGQSLGFYVMANTGHMQIFRINSDVATAGLDVVAVKTELGPVQTLAHQDADGNWVLNDPPPNKALELAKCQRYQLVLPGTSAEYPLLGIGNCTVSDHCAIMLPTPVSMRVKPTAVYTDLNGFVLGQDKVSDQSLNVTNISVGDSLSENSVYLNVYADGLTIGKTYIFTGNRRRTSQLVLDANL